MNRLILLFAFLLLPVCHIQAQINYAGKDFWFTLGGDDGLGYGAGFWDNGYLNIGSRHTATVSLYFTNTAQTRVYTIPADSVVTIPFTLAMNDAISNFYPEQIDNKSLHITSDSDIVVDYFGAVTITSDGTTILPTDNQQRADSFYLVSIPPQIVQSPPLGMHFHFPIVAVCDTVDVEITPAARTWNHPAGVPYTVRLHKGETYQLAPPAQTGPVLTGTRIKVKAGCCQTPVNIFHHSGIFYANIDNVTRCCADAILEQALPVDRFDTAYPVVTWARNPYAALRIFSAAGDNRICFDTTPVRTMAKGAVFDTVVTEAAILVRAEKPVSLAQVMLSEHVFPNATAPHGDPELMYNASVNQGIRESLFGTSGAGSYHYLTIMSRKRNVPSVMLNGQHVDTFFRDFHRNPEWQYAYIPVSPGRTHHLKSDERVVAYYYFIAGQGSYSHNLPDMIIDSLNDGMPFAGATDTIVKCAGANARLTAGPADLYEWSDGSAGREITVTDTGYYWVTERHIRPCSRPWQKHGFYVTDRDTATILAYYYDTVYTCGGPVDLSAGEADHYRWSTGDSTRQISVADTGRYRVTEKSSVSECLQQLVTRAYYVGRRSPGIRPDIGSDTLICEGDSAVLRSRTGTVTWATGDTGTSLVVRAAGIYSAALTDSCGNVRSDTVIVYVRDCSVDTPCRIYFPTAFTPDGNGKNDVFRPVRSGGNKDYHIMICDRWGAPVFESYDAGKGWDGRYKGRDMPVGVYMYICTVTCDGRDEVFKGDLTLIR